MKYRQLAPVLVLVPLLALAACSSNDDGPASTLDDATGPLDPDAPDTTGPDAPDTTGPDAPDTTGPDAPDTTGPDAGNDEDTIVDTDDDPTGENARQEAIGEAIDEADGTESAPDIIQSTLVNNTSESWSCTNDKDTAYTLTFGTDGSGSIMLGTAEQSFTWETTVAPGLVLMSVNHPIDSSIGSISFADTDNFTAYYVYWGVTDLLSAEGAASCQRGFQ